MKRAIMTDLKISFALAKRAGLAPANIKYKPPITSIKRAIGGIKQTKTKFVNLTMRQKI
jgi:hypothetical protein